MQSKPALGLILAGLILASSLASCSARPSPASTSTLSTLEAEQRAGGVHASRSKEYRDMADLAADSTVVVVGRVLKQETVVEDIPYTLSTLEVQEPLHPTPLATAVNQPALSKSSIPTTVVIRQLGTSDMSETPSPILNADGTGYLVFIRPTELPGEAAAQFYVTGGDAGIFTKGADGVFMHKVGPVNDNIPAQITKEEISALK